MYVSKYDFLWSFSWTENARDFLNMMYIIFINDAHQNYFVYQLYKLVEIQE